LFPAAPGTYFAVLDKEDIFFYDLRVKNFDLRYLLRAGLSLLGSGVPDFSWSKYSKLGKI
jgi:hypothetical protein